MGNHLPYLAPAAVPAAWLRSGRQRRRAVIRILSTALAFFSFIYLFIFSLFFFFLRKKKGISAAQRHLFLFSLLSLYSHRRLCAIGCNASFFLFLLLLLLLPRGSAPFRRLSSSSFHYLFFQRKEKERKNSQRFFFFLCLFTPLDARLLM